MLAQYFDTSAFIDPGVGVFGDAARNVGHGPRVVNIDLSIHKGWKLTERFGLGKRTVQRGLIHYPRQRMERIQPPSTGMDAPVV